MADQPTADRPKATFAYFPTLQNREAFFERITSDQVGAGILLKQYLLMSLFAFLYGIIMGSYNSVLQALVAGVKVSVMFSAAILICFPAFFIIQYILGSLCCARY